MLRGEIIGLRARQDSYVEVFQLNPNDVETRMRSDSRPGVRVAEPPYRAPARCPLLGSAVRGLRRRGRHPSDDDAMIGAAAGAGFAPEATLRQFAWVDGSFANQVILGLLATERPPADPYPGR